MSLQTRARAKRRFNSRGTTAVEFALVTPILFTVIFALIDFSHFIILRDTAEGAAREAARTAISYGSSTTYARTRAEDMLAIVGTENATTTFSPATIDEDTTQVTVDISIPFDDNSFFLAPIFMTNVTIRGSSTLACEGYRAANGLYTRPAVPDRPAPTGSSNGGGFISPPADEEDPEEGG